MVWDAIRRTKTRAKKKDTKRKYKKQRKHTIAVSKCLKRLLTCDVGYAGYGSSEPTDWYSVIPSNFPVLTQLSKNRMHGTVNGDVDLTDTGLRIRRKGHYLVIAQFVVAIANEDPVVGIVPWFVITNGQFDPTTLFASTIAGGVFVVDTNTSPVPILPSQTGVGIFYAGCDSNTNTSCAKCSDQECCECVDHNIDIRITSTDESNVFQFLVVTWNLSATRIPCSGCDKCTPCLPDPTCC